MKMLLVAAGGAIGSMARYQIGAWVLARTESWAFPLGTFIVNVLGCLIAGVLIGVAEALTVTMTNQPWAPLIAFSLLIALMIWQPRWL